MKLIFTIFICFILISGSITLASEKDECKFMKEAIRQIKLNPDECAKSNYENNKIFFYSVGAGFAGVVPCFENSDDFSCVNNSYKIEMIWVGGDVLSCEGQTELGKKVIEWAEKYNCRLKVILIENNRYKCGM